MGNSSGKPLAPVLLGFADHEAPSVAPPATLKPRPFISVIPISDLNTTENNVAVAVAMAAATVPTSSTQIHSSSSSPSSSPSSSSVSAVVVKPSKLSSSYFVDLSHLNLCGLADVSVHLGQAPHLRGVHLSFNKLTCLPHDISLLSNLCFLDLSSNRLTHLPDSISQLVYLLELKVARNHLSSLPESITALTKLESLDLSHNHFFTITEKVASLTALASLSLDGNPLTSIPFEVAKLKFLRHLSLEGCPLLEDLPDESPLNNTSSTPSVSEESSTDVPAPSSSQQKASRVPSLKELAARVMVRCSLPPPAETPTELVKYLGSAKCCSFCSGPFFEFHVKKYRFVVRSGYSVPMESRLCAAHWTNDKDRILALFSPAPITGPRELERERLDFIKQRNAAVAAGLAVAPAAGAISPSRPSSIRSPSFDQSLPYALASGNSGNNSSSKSPKALLWGLLGGKKSNAKAKAKGKIPSRYGPEGAVSSPSSGSLSSASPSSPRGRKQSGTDPEGTRGLAAESKFASMEVSADDHIRVMKGSAGSSGMLNTTSSS